MNLIWLWVLWVFEYILLQSLTEYPLTVGCWYYCVTLFFSFVVSSRPRKARTWMEKPERIWYLVNTTSVSIVKIERLKWQFVNWPSLCSLCSENSQRRKMWRCVVMSVVVVRLKLYLSVQCGCVNFQFNLHLHLSYVTLFYSLLVKPWGNFLRWREKSVMLMGNSI